ncbi:hypothetical protein H9635_16055 [Solibacillus sp. A46]|uniref:Uncharacterized protein n=1 Tax=Solibacillus faecavium TaxID=2762221 RepID=A0ABR8Y237_9BACL|nr:hypothetical protein [Solibacillus faecavium]MBD8038268.1 hypothetical protein [Solibacillus faecavium]
MDFFMRCARDGCSKIWPECSNKMKEVLIKLELSNISFKSSKMNALGANIPVGSAKITLKASNKSKKLLITKAV